MVQETKPEPSLTAEKINELLNDFPPEAWTVGYGERFDHPDEKDDFAKGLNIQQNNSATGVTHVTENEYGFDLTSFGEGNEGVENFIRVLDEAGLDPYYDYTRIYRDLGRDTESEYDDYFLFVWSNDEVMIACCNNPLTGETGDPYRDREEKGYASYMGVSGPAGKAEEIATEIIPRYATHIKDSREGGLFF